MIALVQFLQVLLAGIALVALAVGVGGTAFLVFVVPHAGETRRIVERARRAIVAACIVLAAARLGALVLIPLSFADDAGKLPLADLFGTTYARATLAHSAAALALAAVIAFARRGWIALCMAALVVLTGAWLTHAASRVDDAATLMALTVLHQLGAAVWVGGIAHLALARPLARGTALWPRLLARFSPFALSAVLVLLVAGVYLATRYVGSWSALLGTGYGAMVLTKGALLAVALAFAYLNFSATRRWRVTGKGAKVEQNVPAYVQAELAVVITALLTAASLTSQAPAADVLTERASPAEVAAFFAPKHPLLVPPPRDTYLAGAAPITDPFAVPGEIDRAQSNFNHNISGLLVLAIGIAALLERFGVRAARHWPLLFMPLAAFVLLYAEPTVWPLGPEGFWATLAAPGVLQHRLAAVLVVALGWAEWRVHAGGLATTRWRYAFPVLCALGGALLLTHSHTVFATRSEFLIELSHAVLGFLALMTGVARWLELRLPGNSARAMAFVWPLCLQLVGLVLLFYREG